MTKREHILQNAPLCIHFFASGLTSRPSTGHCSKEKEVLDHPTVDAAVTCHELSKHPTRGIFNSLELEKNNHKATASERLNQEQSHYHPLSQTRRFLQSIVPFLLPFGTCSGSASLIKQTSQVSALWPCDYDWREPRRSRQSWWR